MNNPEDSVKMPVSRSQKDATSRPGSRPSNKDAIEKESGSEGVTSASALAKSGTATTSDSSTFSGTTNTERASRRRILRRL
ncbi:unnamed protein product [Euphydryas editha]|uniref:Uncharacterized protein n=1 Tax=Euphydryas editha TaxID=104508 RepID=A0AAU9UA96_EUPED|nr:unnamed protein product [Euphydryas editha]